MRNALLPALLLLFLPMEVAWSEEPPVLEQLLSGQPREMAWGAYRAGRDGDRDAIPFLIDILRGSPAGADATWRAMQAHVLDALVRLRASVPPDVLATWLRSRFRLQALILAAKEPAQHHLSLLEAFERQKDPRLWPFDVAVGNLLAQRPGPGVLRAFLARIPLRLSVTASDPGTFGGTGVGRSLGGRSGDGRARIPPGFPPYVHYGLTTHAGADTHLLADGKHPVHYRRRELAEGRGFGSTHTSLDRIECCLDWVSLVLHGAPGKLPLDSRASVSVEWKGPDEFGEVAGRRRDEILTQWYALVRAGFERGSLTREEAVGLEPRVEVQIHDQRTDRSVALPALPESLVRLELPPARPAAGADRRPDR